MKSENKYIGDDKFIKFLEHYNCPAPLEVVKLRFAGAICSPNSELRPTDVIASFWENNQAPRLETKNEAELFFKFFCSFLIFKHLFFSCFSCIYKTLYKFIYWIRFISMTIKHNTSRCKYWFSVCKIIC